MKLNQIINNYWNNEYKVRKFKDFPSQFSSFVLNEIDNSYPIIDCGCGNGRDSIFYTYCFFINFVVAKYCF